MSSSQEGPLLACDGVRAHYGAMAAVDGLSFAVGHGEILGVGGPNGAGKTTLFDVISGLTRASGGTVTFDGKDITGKSADRVCHAGISRTFQLNAAYDTLTVEENVLCASYFGYRNVVFPKLGFDRAARSRAEEAIAFVGLDDDSNTEVSELPILQRKLLMIAAAVATPAQAAPAGRARGRPQPAGNRPCHGHRRPAARRARPDYRPHRARHALPGGALGPCPDHGITARKSTKGRRTAWRRTERW